MYDRKCPLPENSYSFVSGVPNQQHLANFQQQQEAGSLGVFKLSGCWLLFRKPENSNSNVYRIYPYNSIAIQLERERRSCVEARGLYYMQILDFLASNKSIKQRALLQSEDRLPLQSSWEWIKLSFIDIFFT
jgi:hypothetical protein